MGAKDGREKYYLDDEKSKLKKMQQKSDLLSFPLSLLFISR